MGIIQSLRNYFDTSPLAFMRTVPAEMLEFDQRAKYMCKFGCKNYNRRYSCPPESLTVLDRLQKHKYRWAILLATTYKIDSGYSRYMIKALNQRKEYEIQRICNQIGNILDSNDIGHLLLSGGPCRQCKQCSLTRNEVCRKPEFSQVSMEAVCIDCQKTMHNAGFDFQMPNNGSINRCGCILTNKDELSSIYLNNIESHQKLIHPSKEQTLEMCSRLLFEYPQLYDSVQLISLAEICKEGPPCESCQRYGTSFSCPPYSEKMEIDLWNFGIVWRWQKNDRKKYSYNVALRTIHRAFFSLGYYFALSLRDCYCEECKPCNYLRSEKPICNSRQLLSPSMQSQGINLCQFGEGKFGLELI
jgi:predicted metal-binding protein